jgi:predicted nuclease of predicted toxin-antitoxin system
MKFLIDAHLPMRLANWLKEKGHDVIHTRELPHKNQTDDIDIIQLSVD